LARLLIQKYSFSAGMKNTSIQPRGKSRLGYRYNWWPDLPDQRDFPFSLTLKAPVSVPSTIDLREKCSPIVNQGRIGSCTANALSGHLEFLELEDLSDQVDDKTQTEVFGK